MNLRKLIVHAAMIVVVLIAVRTPAAQRIVVNGFDDFVETIARIVQFPCQLMDHARSFSLDRMDPACPQCMEPLD